MKDYKPFEVVFDRLWVVMLFLMLICGNAYAKRFVMSSELFDVSDATEKHYALGLVTYVKSLEYQRAECPDGSACLHLPAWHIYELTGYFTSKPDEEVVFEVAHYHGAELYSRAPWFVALEEIQDETLRTALGVKYKLVGVEVAGSIFCPHGESAGLFKDWEADYIDIKSGQKCYAY